MKVVAELTNNRHQLSDHELENYRQQAFKLYLKNERSARDHAQLHGGKNADGTMLRYDMEGYKEKAIQQYMDFLIMRDVILGRNF